MKKFLRKVLLLTVIMLVLFVSCFCFGAFIIGSQYSDGYNASILDKVSRLRTLNEPKIILVGDSNLAFGMNSPMLQEAMNMPVVNLGLHGGLGNAFQENMAKLNINSGDIVVICHSSFADRGRFDTALTWITIEYYWDLWPILRAEDYTTMMRTYPVYWFKALWNWLTKDDDNTPNEINTYDRAAFNEYGDVVIKPAGKSSKRELYLKSVERGIIKLPGINDTCINRLNEFNKYVKERGATLLVAGYPIIAGEFTPAKEEYDRFQRELASRLDCEVISDYRDYFIPYEYFYDTAYHLDEEGAKIRTRQLIKDLQNWQKRASEKTGNR